MRKTISILFALFLVASFCSCSQEKSSYEEYVEAINELDSKIYLFGESLIFDYELNYQQITSFSECTTTARFKYIILSADSSFTLGEEQKADLKTLISEDYKIIYVGLPKIFPFLADEKEEFGFSKDEYPNTYMYFYDSEMMLALNSSQNENFHVVYFIAVDVGYYEDVL